MTLGQRNETHPQAETLKSGPDTADLGGYAQVSRAIQGSRGAIPDLHATVHRTDTDQSSRAIYRARLTET